VRAPFHRLPSFQVCIVWVRVRVRMRMRVRMRVRVRVRLRVWCGWCGCVRWGENKI
jgi:hypothetical protein